LLGVGGGVDADVPLLVDREQVGAPVVQVVTLGGITDIPFFHDMTLQQSLCEREALCLIAVPAQKRAQKMKHILQTGCKVNFFLVS
jgi:hypothetical protein